MWYCGMYTSVVFGMFTSVVLWNINNCGVWDFYFYGTKEYKQCGVWDIYFCVTVEYIQAWNVLCLLLWYCGIKTSVAY